MGTRLARDAFWLAVLLPAMAHAQAPSAARTTDQKADDARRAEAKSRYEQGVAAYKKKRFKDAVDLFLEADQLSPSSQLSFNIARAYENIGDDAGSLRWYRDYLRRAPNAPNAAEVEQIVQNLETGLARKGLQQLTVLSSPEGATVTIDDRPLGVTPWTVELAPGTHTVALSLRGFADTEREIELPAGDAIDVSVQLVAARKVEPRATTPSPAVVPAARAKPARDQQKKSGLGVWPWLSMGAGTASLGGALAFEVWRRNAESDARKEPTQIGFKEDLDTIESRRSTARILGVVGGALVVTGGVLLIVDNGGSGSSASTKVSVACLPQSCAIAARGRF